MNIMARKTLNLKFNPNYTPSDYGRDQLQKILDNIDVSINSIEGTNSDLNDGIIDWVQAVKDIRLSYLNTVGFIENDSDYYATLVRGHQLQSIAKTLAAQAELLHAALENYIPSGN